MDQANLAIDPACLQIDADPPLIDQARLDVKHVKAVDNVRLIPLQGEVVATFGASECRQLVLDLDIKRLKGRQLIGDVPQRFKQGAVVQGDGLVKVSHRDSIQAS